MATLEAAVVVLIDEHKQRPEAPQGVWIAATTYQQVGLFSEAANYHDVIVDNWPRYEHHKDAAFNAVLLRTTIGEHDKAIDSGNKFKRHYPRDEGADEVTFLMGKAHEKAEKWRTPQALYDRYAQSRAEPGQPDRSAGAAGDGASRPATSAARSPRWTERSRSIASTSSSTTAASTTPPRLATCRASASWPSSPRSRSRAT